MRRITLGELYAHGLVGRSVGSSPVSLGRLQVAIHDSIQ